MSVQAAICPGSTEIDIGELPKISHLLQSSENLALSFALGAMVLLPLAEILLRAIVHTGISGSSALVQHLTLAIGMLGGAVAAREGRLLSLSTITMMLKGRAKSQAQLLSSSFAAAVTVFLCLAGIQFVLSEKSAAKSLAYGIPLWAVQALLPLGFALIAGRLVYHAHPSRSGKAWAVAWVTLFLALGVWPPLAPEQMILPALLGLLLATILGAPVFITLGGAALILFWGRGQPIAAIPIEHYRLVTNPTLPTIPLFTLAGYFLSEGGAAKRLVRVFQSIAGRFRGGPAIATVLVCSFFTSFTGASGVTILALGGLLMPVLLQARYPERKALGLLTASGSLGLLLPPCLPMILYAVISAIPIKEMFLAGILPGILLTIVTGWWGVVQSPLDAGTKTIFDRREAGQALWEAKWELLLPVVAFASLFGGFATPVEAAALTALYAFVIQTFVHHDLKITKDIPRVMTECGLLIGGVLLILGVALGFTNYLIDAQIPDAAVEWVKGSIHSPLMFLLALNFFLLVVGCLMDIYSAIVVVVPLIIPMGAAFGIDPRHLGIIFLANLELGYLTPPVGMNLFLSSYRFGKPISEVARSILPLLGVLFVGVLLITYVPSLSTMLPQWFK
jgi:C4-dicarboxylate transporter, DctM subunit